MFVCTDIPLADQIVQVGHACLEAGHAFDQPVEPCHLVLLAVPCQPSLCSAVAWAEAAGVRCKLFFEPDDETEPVEPQRRRPLRRFPLWECD